MEDDEQYRKLYNDSVPLAVFYNCARIGKLVNASLWQRDDLSAAERRNILFHTIYATASCLVKNSAPTIVDIEHLEESHMTPELIKYTSDAVLDMFRRHGGHDQVAKGHDFTECLAAWLTEQFSETGSVK